jgi:hypothetical protein
MIRESNKQIRSLGGQMKSIILLTLSLFVGGIAHASNNQPAPRPDLSVDQCAASASPDLQTIYSDSEVSIVVECENSRNLVIRVDIPQDEIRNLYHSQYLYEKAADGANTGIIRVQNISITSVNGMFFEFNGDGKHYNYDIAAKVNALKGYQTED